MDHVGFSTEYTVQDKGRSGQASQKSIEIVLKKNGGYLYIYTSIVDLINWKDRVKLYKDWENVKTVH